MKKFDFIIVGLILFVGAISGIQFLFLNSLKFEILKKLDMQYKEIKDTETIIKVQENLRSIEENISKLDLHLNTRIDKIIKAMDQSISFNNLIEDIGSKESPEVKELKDLEGKLLVDSIETVEADFLIQKLLDQGFFKYSNKNFTEALKIYKEVLDLNPGNSEAICYFYISLYYQNPGDSTHYSDIKNNLTPLIQADILIEKEKSTVLNILKGISLEDGSI